MHALINVKVGRILLPLAMAALFVAIAAPAILWACDDPVYAIARQKWPLERYTLLLAYQPGAGDVKEFEQATRQEWLNDGVNLAPAPFDMSFPVQLSQDRELLLSMGISGYPFVLVLDAGGQPLVRFQNLAEARKRLSPPATEPEVVSYGTQRIELKSPAAAVVIVFDSKAGANDRQVGPDNETVPGDESAPAAAPAPVKVTPTKQLAEQWAHELAGEPLLGLAKARLVDIRNPGQDEPLVTTLKLRPLPVVVLIDPDGQPLETSDRVPAPEEIKKMATSPTRDAILTLLAQPKIAMVLLLVYGEDEQANIAAADATNQAARQAASLYKVEVPVLQMDPADPQESWFVKVVGRTPGQREPMVVPVIGQGKAMETLTAPAAVNADAAAQAKDIEKFRDQVLDNIQLAFHPCGCEVVPREIGKDLLLARSDAKWSPYESKMAAVLKAAEKKGSALDASAREAALASFGIDPRLWVWIGIAAAAGLGLIGGLMLWVKSRSAANGK